MVSLACTLGDTSAQNCCPQPELIKLAEEDIIGIVDRCLNDCKYELDNFFLHQRQLVTRYAKDLLSKPGFSQDISDVFFQHEDVYRLQSQISLLIAKACSELGLAEPAADDLVTISPHVWQIPDRHLSGYAADSRTTLYMAAAADLISDVLCDSWSTVGTVIPGYNVLSSVLGMFECKNVFQKAKKDFRHSLQEIEKRLHGLLDSLHSELEHELTTRVATFLYSIVDDSVLDHSASFNCA